MPESLDPLLADLLEWIGPDGRAYAEVLEAWRTSCPGLPVWEEANSRRLVERRRADPSGEVIVVSEAGTAFLEARRPAPLLRTT
jgi:hypothetical protein